MYSYFDPHSLPSGLRSPGSDQQAGIENGILNDAPVAVKDGVSLLTDAAEEIGLHLSERIERREHDQRRVAPGRSDHRLKIAQINEYLDKARQPPDAQVRYLQVRNLLERAQRPGDSLGRESASSRTPTEHYLLLQEALQKALVEKAPTAVIERLEQAMADIEAASGTQVLADLSTIDQAASFGSTAQEIARFQGAVHTLLDKPTLVQAFKEAITLAEKDGRQLDRAIQHLMDAVGTCLYALGSTQEKVLLQTLVSDLFHLKCLNTLFVRAKSVVRQVRKTQRKVSQHAAPRDVAIP